MEAKQLSVCHRTRSRGCRSWEEREQEAKRALQATDSAWARRLGGGVWGGGALLVSQGWEQGCSPRGLAVTEYVDGYSV